MIAFLFYDDARTLRFLLARFGLYGNIQHTYNVHPAIYMEFHIYFHVYIDLYIFMYILDVAGGPDVFGTARTFRNGKNHNGDRITSPCSSSQILQKLEVASSDLAVSRAVSAGAGGVRGRWEQRLFAHRLNSPSSSDSIDLLDTEGNTICLWVSSSKRHTGSGTTQWRIPRYRIQSSHRRTPAERWDRYYLAFEINDIHL